MMMLPSGRLLLALLLLGFLAAAGQASQGGPRIASSDIRFAENAAHVSVRMDLDLNQSLVDALDGGMLVFFTHELEIVEPRLWGWGERELYRFLAQASVRRSDYGPGFEYRGFRSNLWRRAETLDEALAAMAVHELVLDDPLVLGTLRRLDAFVQNRIEVDLDKLPNPIKIELMTSADWLFSSPWTRLPN
ncbi:MAG: DUF4390 domain-containing protein [Betaproteobacteria bacterium AqS2]|uniref:DUF4390 domain-containing protein n=1 Tax=Candidatus Amphirhobacter heronislandensis TaxID=1732024 RepID=A0A930Y3E8_9GAMM|nr:DUF4390 domain-containing protein [Betaproteobacteria bacterium AqS2]